MGKVYFLQPVIGGNIKIGYTETEVQERFTYIQSDSPLPLRCLGWMPRDKGVKGTAPDIVIHRQFKSSRQYGEWFAPSQELLDFISTNCDSLPYDIPLPNKIKSHYIQKGD